MKTLMTRFEMALCTALAVTTVGTIGALMHAAFNITIVA